MFSILHLSGLLALLVLLFSLSLLVFFFTFLDYIVSVNYSRDMFIYFVI